MKLRYTYASFALWLLTWRIVPLTTEWKDYIAYVFHGAANPEHPWKNLEWFCLLANHHWQLATCLSSITALILFAYTLRNHPWPLAALAIIPWLPPMFIDYHTPSPEMFELIIIGYAFWFVVNNGKWWLINLVQILCGFGLYIHPLGAFVFPAVFMALKERPLRILWVKLSFCTLIIVFQFIQWKELLAWKIYDMSEYLHPAIMLGFPENILKFLRLLFYCGTWGDGHFFFVHCTVRVILFLACGYVCFNPLRILNFTDQACRFCFTYLVLFGLFSGYYYATLTDVLLAVGGLLAIYDCLAEDAQPYFAKFLIADAIFMTMTTAHSILVMHGLVKPYG